MEDKRRKQLERVEQLGDEIAVLAAEIHAAMGRFLALVAEFDELKGWNEACCKSCAHWISWRCGIGLVAARDHVRVARRLKDLPLIRDALERGELSYSKVRALTRLEDVDREADLLDLARGASASQLERMVRSYRGVVAVETGETRDDRFLSVQSDDDGSFVIRGRLRAEEGALLQAALRAASDVLHSEAKDDADHQPAHLRDPDARIRPTGIDALMRIAESYSPDSKARALADRYQVVVHVDVDALASGDEDDGAPSVGALEDGTPLHVETIRRICCDAAVITASERNGRPLRYGRKTRPIPTALRRALRRRDGGCRFPGCTQRHGVDAHHIEHWIEGGPTNIENLLELCRFHHRLLHEGRWRLGGRPDGTLTFHRPDGAGIRTAPRPRRTDPGCLTRRNHAAGVSPTADTCASPYAGQRMHLPYAVDALLNMAPPTAGAAP